MKRNRKSATGWFGVFGHSCSDSDLTLDFVTVVVPLSLSFYEKVIILDSDLDRVTNDHLARNIPVSDYRVSKVIHLHHKTEVCCAGRHFYQFRGSVSFLSGLSKAAQ